MAINVSGHVNGASITSSAKTFSDLSVTVPAGAACFIGRVETDAIRCRTDGTSATSSTGVLYNRQEWVILHGTELNSASFIRVTSDAVLNGKFYDVPPHVALGNGPEG
jgi:hypothetical protein